MERGTFCTLLILFEGLLTLVAVVAGCGEAPEPRDTSLASLETGESVPEVETGAHDSTGLEESDPIEETASVDTVPIEETADPWASVLMECGAWETRLAPVGSYLVESDADAIFYVQEDWRQREGVALLQGALASDVDGDGCSEVLLSGLYYPEDGGSGVRNVYKVAGPVRGTFLSPGPYSAVVEASYDHNLSQLSLGDLDGDGSRDDWLLGALHGGDNGLGAVHLFPEPLSGSYVEDDAVATIWAPDSIAGTSAGLTTGDADGDGADDVVLGWYVWGDDGSLVPELGVFSGPLAADSTYEGSIASFSGIGMWAGEWMTLDADLDGDGLHDLVYGSKIGGEEPDGLLVFRGPLEGTCSWEDNDLFIETETKVWDKVFFPLSAGPDADGDGYEDLLAGENGDFYGKAWLVLGGLDPVQNLGDAHAAFTGSSSWSFPYSLSMEQDVDADSSPDVLIGFPGHGWPTEESEGAALLYYGPIEGAYDLDDADAVFYGSGPGWSYAQVGGFVRGLGDTDGDGFDDFLIGGLGTTPAYLFRGGSR
ncbi:MAG: hypothetical protein ABIO70_28110 [Pseudomonadota bacterium]